MNRRCFLYHLQSGVMYNWGEVFKGGFSGGGVQGGPLRFSSTPKKNLKKGYTLYVSIIIDLTERIFQLKG